MEQVLVTKEGLKNLKDELAKLINEERPEVIKSLQEARALGDLSENADYDAARTRQAEVELRIQRLEAMIDNAVIIEEKKGTNRVVTVGSTVTIVDITDLNGQEETYTIVGSVESDPLSGKISNLSPLAKAILDRNLGDTCSVESKIPYEVKIIAIK